VIVIGAALVAPCGFSPTTPASGWRCEAWRRTESRADAGDRFGYHGGGAWGWVPCWRRAPPSCCCPGNIVVESGYNVLILRLRSASSGDSAAGSARSCAFLIGFAQILTVVYLARTSRWWWPAGIILTLILKPSGLFGRQKELEERYERGQTAAAQGTDRSGIKSHGGIYALMSWREMAYLISPRVLLIAGCSCCRW